MGTDKIDYSPHFTLAEFDAMGYWRCSSRRRSLKALQAMEPSERWDIAMIMTEGWRKTRKARLLRRRPQITEAAIRDMMFHHNVRKSEREREIADRVARRAATL